MRFQPVAALTLAALVLAVACGPAGGATASPSTPPASPAPSPSSGAGGDPATVAALIGRTFIVTAADGYAIVAGSTISFTFENGQLGIRAGCNIIGGAYDIKDGVLATGAMMMTEMACEEPLMAQDTFISGFVNGARLTLDGATLSLARDGVTLTATDETVARPDLPIEGTTWVVDGLIVDQAVSSMPVGVTAKVRFTAGRVEVDAGCNKGKGKAEIGDTAITFGTIGITKMACKDSAMAVEAHVLRVLRGDVAYTIDGDSLTLLGAGGGLMLKAQG